MEKVEAAGAVVKRNITLRRFSPEDSTMINEMSCKHPSAPIIQIAMLSLLGHDYPAGFAEFTSGLIDPPIRSMKELVDFNEKNALRALPEGMVGRQIKCQ